MRVFVETNDKYLWTLKPFSYLFNIYWSSLQEVVVFGYNRPGFSLPPNFTFHSIDNYNYPPEKWTDGYLKFLNTVPDKQFVLMFCDYWLIRGVDHNGVRTLGELVEQRGDVIRMDLTADRLYSHGDDRNVEDFGSYGHYDLIRTRNDVQYQMSFQAAIWNKELLLKVIKPSQSPWEVELYSSPPDDMLVLGTRQVPIKYANGVLKGKIRMDEVERIPQPHRDIVKSMLPPNWETTVP